MVYESSQLADWRAHGHHDKLKRYDELVEAAAGVKKQVIDHRDAAIEALADAGLVVSSERGRLIDALSAARGVIAAGDFRPHPQVVELEDEAA